MWLKHTSALRQSFACLDNKLFSKFGHVVWCWRSVLYYSWQRTSFRFASTSLCWLGTRHCLDAEAEPVWKTAVGKAAWSDLCFSSWRSSLQRYREALPFGHIWGLNSPVFQPLMFLQLRPSNRDIVEFYWPTLWIHKLNGVWCDNSTYWLILVVWCMFLDAKKNGRETCGIWAWSNC